MSQFSASSPSDAVNAAANDQGASRPKSSGADAGEVVIGLARLLADIKFADVMAIDVRGISQVQDYIIIASGTSDRQMRSSIGHIKDYLKQHGSDVYRSSYDDQSTWIVIDCVDVVVHLFEPNTRSYYDLESMWGDGKQLAWQRPGDIKAAEAAEQESASDEAVEVVDLTQPEPKTSKPVSTKVKSVTVKAKKVPKKAVKKTTKKKAAAAKAVKKPAKRVTKSAKKPAKKAAKKVAKKATKKAPSKAAKKKVAKRR